MKHVGKKQNKAPKPVIKRSISAPPELFEQADALMRKKLVGTFSGYVQRLIQDDLEQEAKAA
jgi:hypothetical protein